MAIFNFFRTPKPQRYRYVPRFYDPDKEELEARIKRAAGEKQDQAPEAMKARISAGFKQKSRVDPAYRKQQSKRSNMILFSSIIILLVLAYVLIERYLPTLMEALE